MYQFWKKICWTLLAISSVACNSGVSSDNRTLDLVNLPQLILSSIGVVPILDNNSHVVYLELYNNSQQTLVTTTSLIKPGSGQLQLNLGNCQGLVPNSSCLVAVSLPADLKGSRLVEFEATMADGNHYILKQLLEYRQLATVNSITVGNLPATLVIPKSGQTSAVIPFSISKPMQRVQLSADTGMLSSKIICEDGGSEATPGKLCSMIVKLAPGTLSTVLTLAGTSHSGEKSTAKIMLHTSLNSVASIIAGSTSSVLTPTESITTITLFNNGSSSAGNLNISPVLPLQQSNNSCSGSLAANQSCSFNITSNSINNGQATINVSYDDGVTANNSITLGVGYAINSVSPALQISTTNSLLNAIVGHSATMVITLTNNGNRAFNNIKLPTLARVNSALQYTSSGISAPICATNGSQSLAISASCNIGVIYTPTITESVTSFSFNPIASYNDVTGSSTSYSSSNQVISYSALNIHQVYAGNSKGLVFNESGFTLPGSVPVTPDDSSITAESSINGVIYVGTANSNVYAYDTTISHPAWRWLGNATIGGGTITALVNIGSNLYASTTQNGVWAINPANSASNWGQLGISLSGVRVSAMVVVNNELYVAAGDGKVYWFNMDFFPLSSSNNAGSVSSMVAFGNTLLVTNTAAKTVKYYTIGTSSAWNTLGASLQSSFGGLADMQVVANYIYIGNGNNVYQYDMNQGYSGVWTAIDTGTVCASSGIVYTLGVMGSNLYAGCTNGYVYSHSTQSFNYNWSSLGKPVSGSSGINGLIQVNNKLYAATADTNLYAYPILESNPVWQKQGSLALDGSSVLAQTSLGYTLYAATESGNVFSYDLTNPQAVWQQLGAAVNSNGIYSLATIGNKIIAGSGNSTVYGYDTSSSGANWTILGAANFNSGHIIYDLAISGSKIYAALGQGAFAYVYTYDTASQTPSWTPVSGGSVATVSVYNLVAIGNQLYAGSYAGDIRTYNIITGGSSWNNLSSQPDGSSVYALIGVDSLLYSGTSDGGLFEYDTSAGSPSWGRLCQTTVPNASLIWTLAYSGNSIYAGTANGVVYTCNTSQTNSSWQVNNGLSFYSSPADGSTQINTLLAF